MRDLDMIQSSIDYIEENLRAEISAQELAERANYSLFHYYRLFQTAVGMPVMQYILRRRLLHAIYEIGCGNTMMDTVMSYGFDTYAGFYKAFKREFGYTPRQFLERFRCIRPYRICLEGEDHIMITHKKLREILKNWNMENETITDIIYENGEKNDCAYYVGDDHVVKFYVNLGEAKVQIDISRALEQLGFSVATPVGAANGQEIIEDGQLYYVLTQRLIGERLKAANLYDGDYKAKARFVGEIVGRLNLALKKVNVVVNDVNIYDDVINWALPRVKEIMDIPEDLCIAIVEEFGAIYPGLPRQIIHRDSNPSNIIVSGDKWGFIDFDLSEKNVRIYDPCYAATAVLSEDYVENNEEKLLRWIAIYKNIINGYDRVTGLSKEEKKAIPFVILCNQFICTAWFYERREKYENLYDANWKMTQWICRNFDKLTIQE
ncbi:MAG: helix-turn-helix domain-containing protein [Lachnospiraceae bacterium]|nr:helix-turn-helix domain-containing protein [Lachnospiraceae bacterium]